MNTQPAFSRRLLTLALMPGIALFLVGSQIFHNNFLRYHIGDLEYYYNASAMILAGHLPYR
ncbi:MAG: hypothetical protein M3Y13_07545, partial [Armatimonadota bacterium]|nr:hypothetical protein [Armatimonadota bacterium]